LVQNIPMKAHILRQKQITLAISLALGLQMGTSLVWAQDLKSPVAAVNQTKESTPSVAVADPQAQVLDLLGAFRDAAQNDPTYNAAKAAMLAGKETFWQGLSVLLPQANATWSTNKNNIDYSAHSISNGYANREYSNTGWTVRLSQPLLNWGKFETFRQGDLNAQLVKTQFAAAEQDLVLRVTQAYFNVLTAIDNVDLYRNKKVLISEQLEQAKRNFEVGTATITDTNEAQSRYDLVIAQELAANADLAIKRSALEQIIGHEVNDIKTLNTTAKIDSVVTEKKAKGKRSSTSVAKTPKSPSTANLAVAIPMPAGQTMEDWVNQAEEVNYSVIGNQLALDIAQSSLRGAIAAHTPTVDLVGSRGYTNQVGASSAVVGSSQYFNSQVGVQVTIPLFAGGYTQSVVRQNAELVNQAKANFELARRTVIQNTRQAFLGFNNGLAQVKAYEAAEVSAISSLESNKLGYEVGVRINIDVLNAQDQLFTTRASLYKSRYDTIISGLTLKAQAAVLSDEDLQSVNALLK
jgi:outer membrane protein